MTLMMDGGWWCVPNVSPVKVSLSSRRVVGPRHVEMTVMDGVGGVCVDHVVVVDVVPGAVVPLWSSLI